MEPQAGGMSEAGRLSGVFFEPKKAFEDIAQRPNFWPPLILLTVIAVAFTYLLSVHVGWDNIVRQGMQMNAKAQQQLEQAPPEARERAEAMQRTMAPIFGYGGAILGRPIGFLIWGAILLGILKGMLSAPVRFKQIFTVLWYASLPAIIQAILTGVVMFLKKPEEFNILNPLAFNPAAFMDPATTSKFLYSFASSIDLFTIWTLLLVAVGLKAAGGKKLSFAGAAMAVFVPWGIWVLAKASLAGVFGS